MLPSGFTKGCGGGGDAGVQQVAAICSLTTEELGTREVLSSSNRKYCHFNEHHSKGGLVLFPPSSIVILAGFITVFDFNYFISIALSLT